MLDKTAFFPIFNDQTWRQVHKSFPFKWVLKNIFFCCSLSWLMFPPLLDILSLIAIMYFTTIPVVCPNVLHLCVKLSLPLYISVQSVVYYLCLSPAVFLIFYKFRWIRFLVWTFYFFILHLPALLLDLVACVRWPPFFQQLSVIPWVMILQQMKRHILVKLDCSLFNNCGDSVSPKPDYQPFMIQRKHQRMKESHLRTLKVSIHRA